MTPLTRDDLVRAAGRADFDEDDIKLWLITANTDPGEGADCLPYYKLGLALLATVCGCFHAVAEELEAATPSPAARVKIDRGIKIMLASLRIQSLGPRLDAESAERADRRMEELANWIAEIRIPRRAATNTRAS